MAPDDRTQRGHLHPKALCCGARKRRVPAAPPRPARLGGPRAAGGPRLARRRRLHALTRRQPCRVSLLVVSLDGFCRAREARSRPARAAQRAASSGPEPTGATCAVRRRSADGRCEEWGHARCQRSRFGWIMILSAARAYPGERARPRVVGLNLIDKHGRWRGL